jgi:thiamine-monophosphate kinase
MAVAEFEIIRRYFTRQQPGREDVVAGVGDDAALLCVPAGMELVVCIDTLVAGVHFPEYTSAAAIGHKALAVNLSDLAAMGAEPAWATLSLSLPDNEPAWLEDFARGFFALADRYRVQLVGGDTTRGPLVVTVQAHGFVPAGTAMRRQGARPGDRIYVTGSLGDAGLALQLQPAAEDRLQSRLDFPEPRVDAGLQLRGLASAAIDISDGLLADLGHLLEADGPGAVIEADALPRSAAFLESAGPAGAGEPSRFYELPLGAGDDYELCFTVPPPHCAAVERRLASLSCGCRAIGVIETRPGIRCRRADGERYLPVAGGYQHFAGGGHG